VELVNSLSFFLWQRLTCGTASGIECATPVSARQDDREVRLITRGPAAWQDRGRMGGVGAVCLAKKYLRFI
jgi:hypothetical protein